MCVHALSLTLISLISLTLTLSLSQTVSLSHSITLSLPRSLTLSLSLTLSQCLALALTRAHCHTTHVSRRVVLMRGFADYIQAVLSVAQYELLADVVTAIQVCE